MLSTRRPGELASAPASVGLLLPVVPDAPVDPVDPVLLPVDPVDPVLLPVDPAVLPAAPLDPLEAVGVGLDEHAASAANAADRVNAARTGVRLSMMNQL